MEHALMKSFEILVHVKLQKQKQLVSLGGGEFFIFWEGRGDPRFFCLYVIIVA